MGSDKDNRNLQDSDSNQKLSRDEIEQMKKEGVTGEVRRYRRFKCGSRGEIGGPDPPLENHKLYGFL